MRSRPIPLRQDSSVGLRFHAAVTPENDPDSPHGARSEKATTAIQIQLVQFNNLLIRKISSRH
jgi:hypothetical protein